MSAVPKVDRIDRLESYIAALRPPSWRAALKRSAAHWQLYAAVTGSAMAMATNASVLGAGGIRDIAAGGMPDHPAAKQFAALTQDALQEPPLMKAARLAMARRKSGLFLEGRAPALVQASQSPAPMISSGGIVPLDSSVSVIQPGEWVSIYGSNLASGTAVWSGDFPTALGGTSVEINGRAAFLSFVSPSQINLQAPDDTATGPVQVVVTTGAGTATSIVTLSSFSPSFLLRDATHVMGIILRPGGGGSYGNGAYDILGPTGYCFGYYSVGAQPGDIVELFGVGFGPTNPPVPAGTMVSGAAPIDNVFTPYINNVLVQPTFVGLSSTGLYQVNLAVPPGLGDGDVSIQASVGGMPTQDGLVFSLQGVSSTPPICVYTGDGGDGGDGGVGDGGGGDGGVGDGGGGDGGGGDGGGDGGDGGDGGC